MEQIYLKYHFLWHQQWTKEYVNMETLALIIREVLQTESSENPVGGAIITLNILQLIFLGFRHLLHLCLLAKFSYPHLSQIQS